MSPSSAVMFSVKDIRNHHLDVGSLLHYAYPPPQSCTVKLYGALSGLSEPVDFDRSDSNLRSVQVSLAQVE